MIRLEKLLHRKTTAAAIMVAMAAFHLAAQAGTSPEAQALVGAWDAQAVSANGQVIPLRLDIASQGKDGALTGTFFSNLKPLQGTVVIDDGKAGHTAVTIQAEEARLLGTIDRVVQAELVDGKLQGTLAVSSRDGNLRNLDGKTVKGDDYTFTAVHRVAAAAKAPDIHGEWEIPLDAPNTKGERSLRLLVQQNGVDASASILRVDGDGGAYDGYFRDGQWVLSQANARGLASYVVKPLADGSLSVKTGNGRAVDTHAVASDYAASGGAQSSLAFRPAVARQKGFPEPADYAAHTTVRDSSEKFAFNFPDALTGKPVSQDDPRFKGKVVLAVVTGTWCPNCHDEVQYLVELDKKYRDKGLAIVALDFEEPEQLQDLSRQKRLVEHYGVEYTYLIAGTPAQMWEKVPQLVNLNTWPATVFVGKDGLVKRIHSGFASPASAEYNKKLQEEFTATIDKLLAEPAKGAVADSDAPADAAQPRALTAAN